MQKKEKISCCGIIGIISKKRQNVSQILTQGIELLKNRGYDSAGIMTLQYDQQNLQTKVVKHADSEQSNLNCIERVIKEVTKNTVKSHIGIGHTRWATCGEKLTKNAHPHWDQSETIFLVHNGIIGNHSKIKIQYLSGVKFTSDTDTQVIVQILGKFKKNGFSIIDGLKQIQKISSKNSQWGLVIVDKERPNCIYTSTKGSPLLIGIGDQEIFVASESIAFQKYTKQYFQTGDGQILELQIESLKQLKNKLKQNGRLKYINNNEDVLKNPPQPFKRFYQYEIRKQGQIEFKPDFERVKAIPFGNYATLIGCGSSYYACQATQYFFKHLNTFKKINIYDPVELQANDIAENETVILISQSGETKDLINVLENCREKEGVKTIGIINVEGSTLARKVDFPIYIKVGREVAVAATKSFFHQCLNLIQFSTQVAQRKRSAPIEQISQIRKQLLQMKQYAKQTIQMVQQKCRQLAKIIHKKQSVYLLALREALAIAKQAALKIKELNYIHAEALGACEMKHGPIALIKSDQKWQTVVFLFVLDNETYELLMNAVDQMSSRNAYVILITNCQQKIQQDNEKKKKESSNWKQNYNFVINVPKLKHLSHLLTVIPMQILVEQICNLNNINPDMPRNLAKTVTV